MRQETDSHNKQWYILLADDDYSDRFFFKKALEKLSIQANLSTVNDGEQLMDFLKNSTEKFPDIIFLDLNMPRKTGRECLLELKKDEKLKNIPVIIYSTSLHDEAAETLYKIGAHYYLQKCNLAELPEYIQKTITLLSENSAQPPKDKFILNNRTSLL